MSTMALNIKNPTTHRLAIEVAELTGETMTQAITVALTERLERLRRSRDVPAVLSRVRSILQDLEPEVPPDHGALLYDQDGLP